MVHTQFYSELKSQLNSRQKLIAVSKTKPVEDIQALYGLGQRVFGENKVQELLEKKDMLPKDIEWHFIGSLQENKVNKVVGKVSLIHSVDKVKLAEKIDRRAGLLGIVQPVLIQMNLAKEASKSGFLLEGSFYEIFESLLSLNHIEILGLMTMGPHVDDEAQISDLFRKCKSVMTDLNQRFKCSMKELSMGMSGDYKLALNEGSTMIRVGSLLFGQRR